MTWRGACARRAGDPNFSPEIQEDACDPDRKASCPIPGPELARSQLFEVEGEREARFRSRAF
jgi:hypothetical protein